MLRIKLLYHVNKSYRSIERNVELIEKRKQVGLTGKVLNRTKDAKAITDILRDMSYYVDFFHVRLAIRWSALMCDDLGHRWRRLWLRKNRLIECKRHSKRLLARSVTN